MTPRTISATARRAVAAGALATTLLAGAAVPARAAAASVPPPCGQPATAAPLPLPGRSAPAGPALRQLAERITAAPADAQTGRYTRLTVAMSAADTSVGDCVETVTAVAGETRWRDEVANSGRIIGTPWHTHSTPAPPVVTTDYRPGELTGVVPGRVPTDPGRLAAALDAAFPPDDARIAARRTALEDRLGLRRASGTARRVEAVGDLVSWHDTPLAARRAILRVLADVPGLLVYGPVTVRGKALVAVSATDGVRTYVLVIDAGSGEIRAAETVLTDRTIGGNLAVRVPYSLTRTVFVDRGRTARTGPVRPTR